MWGRIDTKKEDGHRLGEIPHSRGHCGAIPADTNWLGRLPLAVR